MLKIFVLGGSAVGETYDCRGGETFGRAPECEVRLPDRSISRKHARLEREGDEWTLVDLDSRNGLHVDGQRMASILVTDGIEVTVGELPLRFRIEGASAPAPAPVAQPAPAARPKPRAQPPVVRPPVPVDEADEFVLEDVEELDRTLVEGAAKATSRPVATETKLKGAEARRREILAGGADGGGFLGGDLAQRPLWVQALVGLFLLIVFAAVAYGAFVGIVGLRSS